MCTDERCVREKLKDVVDFVLYHNRKIVNRVDDSVLRVSSGRVLFLRRSRGYAPLWIKVKRYLKHDVVAVGAELQNAGAVGFQDKVLPTQYIGDTDELETLSELGYRARIRNHGHSCFLCEIVIRSQFHTTYEPEA